MHKYFANKHFYLEVLAVAIPMMLQNLVTTCVNIVDSLMVGQLGDAAVSGVAAVNRFYMIGNFGTMGVAAAVGIFIAQYFGANQEEKMKQSYRVSLIGAYMIIAVMFLIAFFFPEQILLFFIDDPETIKMGVDYLSVACYSFLPLGFTIACASAMRSIGQPRIPLIISVISVLTNAVLNYCLIFGHFGFPMMGVKGAALATLIARIVEMLGLLIIVKLVKFSFDTKLKNIFSVPRELVQRITIKAIPLCCNEILWSGGTAMILKFYGTRGTEVLSGYSICTTVTDIFFTLFSGMAVATTVMVSQRLGANKLEEARRNGYYMMGFAGCVALIFAVLMFMTSFTVPYLYGSLSIESQELAMLMMKIQAVFFILYTLNCENFFIVRAGGDTKSTLLMDSVFMWCIQIPLLAIIAYFTNINIFLMYMLGQSTDILKFIFSYRLVRNEKWVVNLTHDSEVLEG